MPRPSGCGMFQRLQGFPNLAHSDIIARMNARRRDLRVWMARGTLTVLAVAGLVWLLGAAPRQGIPPAPVIYQGLALGNGAPAPAGPGGFGREEGIHTH